VQRSDQNHAARGGCTASDDGCAVELAVTAFACFDLFKLEKEKANSGKHGVQVVLTIGNSSVKQQLMIFCYTCICACIDVYRWMYCSVSKSINGYKMNF
jgi:hypothetical protein